MSSEAEQRLYHAITMRIQEALLALEVCRLACLHIRACTNDTRTRARAHTHTHTHTLTARLCRYAPKGRGSKGLASAARVSTKSTARLPV